MTSDRHGNEHSDLVCMYAMQALAPRDVPVVEAQIAACPDCRDEFDALRPVVDSFVSWPVDILRPSRPLWERLAERVGVEAGAAAPPRWVEPEWEEVAPGISVKMLSSDPERHQVSMLVRLEPGVEYPPHTHAGLEELHLLHGELWINDRKLHPGDFSRAEAGSADHRVWSETGCTCVLITSAQDVLR